MPGVDPSELASVPLFGSLSPVELREVAQLFEAKDVGAGVRLAGEGATGYSFFVIAVGEVAVTADGRELGTLGPGQFFGEIALLGGGRRTATVTTRIPTRVLVLFGPDFARLRAAHPAVAAEIDAALDERLGQS